MKTVTLNCASCGAPVFIPDGAETFVCPSCQTTLMVDRGEGYITLKVLEKLSDSIQEMGKATSSAIEQNTYATQKELKRMQLQHLVSLEEMKLSSLQGELRGAAWRAPANTVTPEMEEIVLNINESRMHIRSLKKEIAQLDPNWEDSQNAFRQDVRLLEEAIAFLTPYQSLFKVSNALAEVSSEHRRAVAALNQLVARHLKRDVESLQYPSFHRLTLDQMGELMEKIPGDLKRLEVLEKTDARDKVIVELTETLQKIKEVYPRKKLESLVGPVVSLDYKKPFPNSMEERQPLLAQVNADLDKVNSIPAGVVRTQFNQQLHALIDDLNTYPVKGRGKDKTKKRKGRGFLIFVLVILGMACLLALVIFGTAVYRKAFGNGSSSSLGNQIEAILNTDGMNENGDSSAYASGQFNDYQMQYVEVTTSTTYLRESPSTESAGSYKVVQGDILMDMQEAGLSEPWFKVMTLDGSATGYLVRDWVNPINVVGIPGDYLYAGSREQFYAEDFSTSSDAWEPSDYDDEYATGSTTMTSGEYILDMTSNDAYIYRYANQTVEGLPEDYIYSLTMTNEGGTESVYYGLQTNVKSDDTFDAMLIAPDGTVKILAVRNYDFNLLYDSADPINTMAPFYSNISNTLSVHRYIDSGTGQEVFEYAMNSQILVRISYGQPDGLANDMGLMVYLDAQGTHTRIAFDDFIINK